MGAIVAAVTFGEAADAQTALRMLRAAPHRGRSERVEVAGSCAIGVSHPDDPVDASVTVQDRWAAALVGDLDNYHVLATELQRAGVQGPDPDAGPAGTVLLAFKTWGAAAVNRFRGAFAGIVWDGERLWCFRDQVGFQPLFYRSDGNRFFCASEAKQVAAGADLVRAPDLDALELLFYRGIGEETAIKGVKRFFSAALARVETSGIPVISRYWDPSGLVESARIGQGEARERLVEMLDQAVTRVVTGRDAVELSGGIDSPTIAAFAASAHRRIGGTLLLAINTSYPDYPSVDESAYARLIAEHLGIQFQSHVLSGTPLDDIEQWITLSDGPWDTLPMPLVAQEFHVVRQLGIRTILSGELAEYVYTISPSLLGHLFLHGRWRGLARHMKGLRARGASWPSLGRRLAREALPGFLGRVYGRLRRRSLLNIPDWVSPGSVRGEPYRPDLVGPARQRWRRAQLLATQGTTTTLEAEEICATSCGVRIRRPLADVDLWEFFLSLPAEVKFPDPVPKSFVRQTMRGRLPDAILDRRSKTVFDEHALGTADYPALRRWIDPSRYRMRGVDYDALGLRLERQALNLTDLLWAYDLAKVHAFMSSWS